jgi:hypothetical protein
MDKKRFNKLLLRMGNNNSWSSAGVLGPLSFLLYIHDLMNAIPELATPILFADDTKTKKMVS